MNAPTLPLLERLATSPLFGPELQTTFARLARELDRKCVVAVVGSVDSGKSSFINALLGADLAKVGATETTATVNRFRYGQPNPERPVRIRPLPHTNDWRSIDASPAGLDAWLELNDSWVVLSEDSDPTVGGAVEGAFRIAFLGDHTRSRIFVEGLFEVPAVKRDRWTGRDVDADRWDTAGEVPCIHK